MRKQEIGLCLTLWICAGCAFAQRGMNIRFTGPTAGGNSSHQHFPRPFLTAFPYWTDFASPAELTPSVIVVQTPAPAQNPPPKSEEPKSSAPLMIEWQGDRFVRRTTARENSNADQPDDVAEGKPSAQNNRRALSDRMESKQPQTFAASVQLEEQTIAQSKSLPTIFIFRDGHREQSADYSIISGIIYAREDYWMTGQWSRQIRLSDLDLPSTIQANQSQGTHFRLPTAPNEVITRP